MGLFTGILLLPLAPVRGVAWIATQVAAEADRILAEQGDPRRLLGDLEQARTRGEISEEEYQAAEETLLRRVTESSTVVLDDLGPDDNADGER
ncbi:MAG: gas vesicle protein GvpG [Myxococcaceae bacterium]